MIKIIDNSKCSGCSACATICPKNCIKMLQDNEGFLYPKVDTEECIECGLCLKTCPHNTNETVIREKRAYAVINKDEKIRINSSSGGVFSLLAQAVIDKGGVVFGASFNDSFEVEHVAIEKIEEIERLQGSKYVQSNVLDTFKQAKLFLETGRLVLFTGTPCQIAGLKAFLKNDYENLVTQDLICHGVPSPMVWQKYIEYRTTLAGASARRISSRHKKYGWKRFSVSFSYENDTEYLCQFYDDPYMRTFLKNLSLRQSCYSCNFNGDRRVADITLADFWGVEKIDIEMDDGLGTSLVIVNTIKGAELFDNIKNKVIYKEENLENAIKYNTSYCSSVQKPNNRDDFIFTVKEKGFEFAYKKYAKETFARKMKNIIKRIIRKFFRR